VGARDTHEFTVNAHSSDEQSDISGPLQLPPIIMMDSMISKNRYYCGVRDTRAVADNTHSSDGPYDISGLLLLWGK
jgi:hypothetical protein